MQGNEQVPGIVARSIEVRLPSYPLIQDMVIQKFLYILDGASGGTVHLRWRQC
jgi:hypothetical protein